MFGPSYRADDEKLEPLSSPSLSREDEKDSWTAGPIALKDVHFHYASRAATPVLSGINISISPGTFIALVGPSGGGKSTIINLLPGLYHPTKGTVSVSDRPLGSADADLSTLRDALSLVSQEPVLFSGTIRENVEWGLPPLAPPMTDDQLIASCKDANIHDYIVSLPEAYDTLIGSKGVTLSGGQRQRITIARALLRNPRILLLDEATSALDSESEGLVQEALHRAAGAEGRTTIAVAHRLSTIRHAQEIYVIDKGVVCEKGSHSELVAKNGLYRSFVEEQDLTKE